MLELADYALLGIDTCRLVEEEALREVLFEKRLEHILSLSQAQNKKQNKEKQEKEKHYQKKSVSPEDREPRGGQRAKRRTEREQEDREGTGGQRGAASCWGGEKESGKGKVGGREVGGSGKLVPE